MSGCDSHGESHTSCASSSGLEDQVVVGGHARRGFVRAAASGVLRATGLTWIVVLSLLCFPCYVPWMLAFWLLWHSVAVTRGKLGWVPLATCCAVLFVKRVYWAPMLVLFVCIALVVVLWQVSRLRKPESVASRSWIPTLGLWCVWVLVAVQWNAIGRCSHAVRMEPDRPVVCLGDSLTSGLLPDRGYPDALRGMIRLPVVNLGQSGIATQAGLARLPRLAGVNPQAVVIELGGHDFLLGRSRAATKKNLEQLIVACRKMGAEVVLVEIPRGFMTDPFAGLERELAHEHDVDLVSDSAIRQLVLWSPISPPGMWVAGSHLSDDGIHTNTRGSRFVARYVAEALERMYGSQVLVE